MEDSKVITLSDGNQLNVIVGSDTNMARSEKTKKNNYSKIADKEDSERNKQQSVKKLMIYRQIGAKIAYYRTLRQMSQRELASKVNLSTSTLGRIERGKYNSGVSISRFWGIYDKIFFVKRDAFR